MAERPPTRAVGTRYGHAPEELAAAERGEPGREDAFALEAVHKLCSACGRRYPESFGNCPADGTRLVAADDLVGTTLGGAYRILRVLGEGSMGRIYEAQHVRIAAKRFAIKTLHADLACHPDIVSRFQREAEAAASITSPHVIGVYDVDRAPDGRPFLVSEFLEGTELGERLQQGGRIPARPAVRIVRQLCVALAAAHARGVVHRDMKPENVFLTGDAARPTAKVIDFGISKVDDRGGAVLTKAGMVLGTPAFMAPEQARGAPVDHRVDVYAVGAVLYTMLTGRRPFDREDQAQTLLAVLEETPPRPRSLEPSIPDALELVVQRAMAKEAADRFATMTELHEALAPWDVDDVELPAAPGAGSRVRTAPPAPTLVTTGRQTLALRAARPLLALFCTAGAIWIVIGLATTIGGLIRMSRGGPRPELTTVEATLLYLGLAAVAAPPLFLLVRHVRRSIWDDGNRVLELLPSVRDPVVLGLAVYGFASLLLRAVASARELASPEWDVILTALGLATTAVAALLAVLGRRKRA